nr:hypothetical protein [uncultured Pseudodesulfovibrio sp.]
MHTRINREKLFDLIWSIPTSNLAEELGVSDVAIAKWCKRMEIPKPPWGYWAKKQVGKTVPPKPRLKKLTKKGVGQIQKPQPTDRVKKKKAEEPHAKVVSGSLNNPHKLVQATRKALKNGKPWEDRNIIYSKSKRILDIQLTKASVDRACSIFDSLIKTLEKEGLEATLNVGEQKTKTIVKVDGYDIEIGIDEKTKRVEFKPDKDSNRRHWHPRHEFLPTGTLALVVRGWPSGERSEWKDGKVQRIENLIPSMVNTFRLIAVRHHEWELRQLEWERQRKLAEEVKRQRLLEELKGKEVIAHMQQWELAQKLHTFLDEVQTIAPQSPELDEYIAWGRRYANQVNPLSWPKRLPFDEEKLSNNLPYSYR